MDNQRNRLTPLQERFAQEYAANPASATEAAVRAGYAPGDNAKVQACRNLDRPHVLARIEELRAPVLERVQATAEEIVAEIERAAFAEPEEPPTWSQKNRALDLLAKIHSLYRDAENPVYVQVVQQIRALEPTERRELLADRSRLIELLEDRGFTIEAA